MQRYSPEALASLIAVSITPLVGIVLLGWHPAGVLISYFVDTFVGFGVVMLLTMAHVTGDESHTPIRGWRRWARLVAALVFLGALLLIPLALPLLAVLGADVVMQTLLDSASFRVGLGVQVLMSVVAAIGIHRQLAATHEDDRILSARFLFLAARWLLVFLAVATGFVPALGTRVGSVVLIALYAGASIYFELFPEHAVRFVRGRKAPPMTFQDDLDAKAARQRRHRRGSTN